ncbi:ATP synthase subunit K, mitochondrial [Diutina rugosa]
MGATYQIFGKAVPAHVLALTTLGSVVAIAAWPRAKKDAAQLETKIEAPKAVPQTQSAEGDFDLEKWLQSLDKEEK